MFELNTRLGLAITLLLLLAANTIIFCFCNGALLKCLYKMAASLKGKRTPITTPPYQVPSVDITPDPPIFSLVTTFNWRGMDKNHYQVGDRIMQLMIIPYPQVEFEETDTLSDTERSVGGFGSTGN